MGTVLKQEIVALHHKVMVCMLLISIPWSDWNIENLSFFFLSTSAAFQSFVEARSLMNLKQLLRRISSTNEKTGKIVIIS